MPVSGLFSQILLAFQQGQLDLSGSPKQLLPKYSFNGKGNTVGTGAFSYAHFLSSKFAIMMYFESFSRAKVELGLFGKTVKTLAVSQQLLMNVCVSSELTQLCQ